MSSRGVVLLIEDDPDIRELLAGRLKRLGMEVVTANTGVRGVEMAREMKPDLLILDIGLPDIDGWEVIARLADDSRTDDIPVVVASIRDPGQGTPQVVAHLVKPIKRGALEDAVNAATHRSAES